VARLRKRQLARFKFRVQFRQKQGVFKWEKIRVRSKRGKGKGERGKGKALGRITIVENSSPAPGQRGIGSYDCKCLCRQNRAWRIRHLAEIYDSRC